MPVSILRVPRILVHAFILALSALMALPALAAGFTFAAIGDMPYGTDARFLRLIDRLNQEPLAFTVHVGDIKSGATRCSDETFQKVRGMFDRFEQALVYTPGDNEWTDCHRMSNGAMDPPERLAKIRSLFFSSAMSLGRHAIRLEAQSEQEAFRPYVENRMWTRERVTFATVHMVGSNNNRRRDGKADKEFHARDEANRHWMARAFAQAKARGDVAVVLAMQADTFYRPAPDDQSGFKAWLDAFEREAKAWGKPVLLIQGDTHRFRIDQPYGDAAGRLQNVTRLVVPGAGHVAAVLVRVDTDQPQARFSFKLLSPDEEARQPLAMTR